MNHCMITFRSVTPAQRGEGMLRRAGVECTIARTPRWMEEQGCGYSLRLWTNDPGEAVTLLRSEKIPMQKVYIQTGDGTLEEIAL